MLAHDTTFRLHLIRRLITILIAKQLASGVPQRCAWLSLLSLATKLLIEQQPIGGQASTLRCQTSDNSEKKNDVKFVPILTMYSFHPAAENREMQKNSMVPRTHKFARPLSTTEDSWSVLQA